MRLGLRVGDLAAITLTVISTTNYVYGIILLVQHGATRVQQFLGTDPPPTEFVGPGLVQQRQSFT